ncbi:MAG: hypothetical protein H0U65_02310 [Rubrobacter sp.]|nr:hypothetical protein [Rubrobacter sp.]
MLENFTIHTFSECVGDVFRVLAGGTSHVEIILVSATELGGENTNAIPRKPFSLVFRGPKDIPLSQRTYEVEHEGIGAFALFLVPVGPDGEGMGYEAIFT